MRILFVILAIILVLNSDSASAEEQCNTVNVKVNGLVCDFCARALEKVFSKREEVSGIKVDLNNGNVLVNVKPGNNIDDATLTKLITDSGYSVTGINRGC